MKKIKTILLEEQIKFIGDARKLIRTEDAEIVWNDESENMLEHIEQSLIALRNLFVMQRYEGTLDTTLPGCRQFIDRELRFYDGLPHAEDRRRMLKAVDENLYALDVFVRRTADIFIQLPGNSPESAEENKADRVPPVHSSYHEHAERQHKIQRDLK